MVDESVGFASSVNGRVFKTTNYGASWTSVDTGTGVGLVGFYLPDAPTLHDLHSFPTRRSSDLLLLDVAYVGNHGTKLMVLADWNQARHHQLDRKSTRLNSSHITISYAVFCLKKKPRHHLGHHGHRYGRRVRRLRLIGERPRLQDHQLRRQLDLRRHRNRSWARRFLFTGCTHPPRSTLFPYTTLFRSPVARRRLCGQPRDQADGAGRLEPGAAPSARSEEHTSELQSHHDLVCRLLLEKKTSASPGTSRTSIWSTSP